MARIVIEGVTLEQAKVYLDYFVEQGDQDMEIWFEEYNVEAFMADLSKKPIMTDDEITIYAKT